MTRACWSCTHKKCFSIGRTQKCIAAEMTVLAAQKKSFHGQKMAKFGCNEVVLSRHQLLTSLRTNMEGKK